MMWQTNDYIPDLTERYPEGFRGGNKPYIPEEPEEPEWKRFAVGQKYCWTDWFTGGQSWYMVKEVTETEIVLFEYRVEIDGEYQYTQNYELHTDDNGSQYILMCEYHGHEGRLYAKED